MKILLADDHALFREGMRHVMRQLDGHLDGDAEILDACTFPEALRVAEENPDISLALLDLKMPGSDGVSAIKLFRSRHPDIVVVVLSGTDQREDILGAMNSGAMGFVSKSSNSKEMVHALRMVLDGGTYLPPQLLQQTGAGDADNWHPSKLALTARQSEMLRYLGLGWSNKSIAEATGLSQGTVKVHIAALYNMLHVGNRLDAVLAGRRLGLLETEEKEA